MQTHACACPVSVHVRKVTEKDIHEGRPGCVLTLKCVHGQVAARQAERSALETILLGHGIVRPQEPMEGTPETFPASEEPSAKRQRTGDTSSSAVAS
jgi:hypothetical protein